MKFNLGVLCLSGALLASPGSSFGADAGSERTSAQTQVQRHYVGVGKCALCHARTETKSGQPNPGNELVSTDFVRLTEVNKWYEDKHRNAYVVLTKDLGLQISKVLGIPGPRDMRCISCHGTVQDGKLRPGPELVQGVTCEACHGPAGDWWVPHSEPSWRTKSTHQKQQLGMVDLRDPGIRARKCLSCHIGNAQEGKLVTHEMYAAGHPPLPGVEIETHLRAMPKHWKNLAEKNEGIRALLRYDPKQTYRTKSVVLGGVLAYREWLNYMAANTSSKLLNAWEDFALYDCYGCHHDLKSDSWRQKRGYPGIAGRLYFPVWPHALVKLAIFHLSGSDAAVFKKKYREFTGRLDKVASAYNAQAFRADNRALKPDARPEAIDDLLGYLNKLAADIEASTFDRAATVRMLRLLSLPTDSGDADAMEPPDYSTARQIAWAIISLYADLQSAGDSNIEIEKIIAQLKNTVDLNLPGRARAGESYRPEEFSKQVSHIAQVLKP
jgi:hypothetical protein